MIYLDNGATSFRKPPAVERAMVEALHTCANPGRGGYETAMAAARTVYRCREMASQLFDCEPEQAVITFNCTHGLNIGIRSIVKPGGRVVISGFEHNAVVRPLEALGANVTVAGRKLFDPEDTLDAFYKAIRQGVDAAVFTHVSNVFGHILPVEELAQLCTDYNIPFIVDAAQSAGVLPISLKKLGADYIAMPGHKGLLGPQGTGLLLCREPGMPLLYGGTGNASRSRQMPLDLPERLEAGTLNVPGIAGLAAGMQFVKNQGLHRIFAREHAQLKKCVRKLQKLGMHVFSGENQAATVSFLPGKDCEEAADLLGQMGIAVRAGLHCAPLAHESAGTLETGTVRVSFGWDADTAQTVGFLRAASKLPGFYG
ncbi:MAG: aminotransferase class V-fold PLP-dependent enzyme [Oscillospiraceae bacterium]|nr:aminotransferase class V-fold PLP-dependent enzyme [Oscillospiraceae bacterium]